MTSKIEKIRQMEPVFIKVAKHLLAQNEKSVAGERKACLYRSPQGLQCAVGCLITDDAYSKDLEGCAVYDKAVEKALKDSGIPLFCEMDSMLIRLQTIHDNMHTDQWLDGLRVCAVTYLCWSPEYFEKQILS
jgi:hypothetical protein